jgi:hypothetical protein
MRRPLLTRPRTGNRSRTESKLLKTLSTTPREVEIQQNSPTRTNQKCLEVRRISYQSIRSRAFRRADSSVSNKRMPRMQSNAGERNASLSPRKKDLKIMQNIEKNIGEEMESEPESRVKTYYNERVYWRKRKGGEMPLCIINFNGVMGDYSKSVYWESEDSKVLLVEGLKPGIKLLSLHFYIAVVSWFSREVTKVLLSTLEEQHIMTDAVYIVRHRKLKHRFRHNYSQILEDFLIQDRKNKSLVLSALALSRDEVISRKGSDLFYEKSLSGCNKFVTIGMPVACGEVKDVPMCVLVPHYRTSEEHISFFDLAKFVVGLKTNCDGKLEQAEHDGEIALPCEHQEIPLIPKLEGSGEWGTKYAIYSQCQTKKTRPPISRKSSRIKAMTNNC